MFGKSDLIQNLTRELGRIRDKRDALTCEVTTLTAEIAVLEARISAENDRRERERAANEIELIKKQVKAQHLALMPVSPGCVRRLKRRPQSSLTLATLTTHWS